MISKAEVQANCEADVTLRSEAETRFRKVVNNLEGRRAHGPEIYEKAAGSASGQLHMTSTEPESGTLGGFMILVVAITILYFAIYWIGSLFLEYYAI